MVKTLIILRAKPTRDTYKKNMDNFYMQRIVYYSNGYAGNVLFTVATDC